MKDLRTVLILLGSVCFVAMLFNPAMIIWFMIKGVGLAVILWVVNTLSRIVCNKSFVDLIREAQEDANRKEGP